MNAKSLLNKVSVIILLLLVTLTTSLFSQIRSVQLSSFYAQINEETVELFWITDSETGNVGWNIYRSDSINLENAFLINPSLIMGAGTTSEPTEYEYIDEFPVFPDSDNTFFYWLESIDITGYTEIFGPVLISIPLPIVLSSFTAFFYSGNLIINWTTQSESGNLGWNVYRGESENAFQNDEVIQINSELIPGAGTTSEATEYEFLDEYEVNPGTTYFYWLECVNYSGETYIFGPIAITIPVATNDNTFTNPETQLFQNYPNPFRNKTEVSFSLSENVKDTKLTIYNIKGWKVKQFSIDDERSSISWNGTDESGKPVAAGIYFYRLQTGNFSDIKKMILLW